VLGYVVDAPPGRYASWHDFSRAVVAAGVDVVVAQGWEADGTSGVPPRPCRWYLRWWTQWYPDLYDVGWPDSPHRALRNSTARAWEAAGRPLLSQPPTGHVQTEDGLIHIRYRRVHVAQVGQQRW
jgi:hypothetical protein